MKVIYKPSGRAKEYSPLAVNLYSGCTNGCLYCYVPNFCKINKIFFHSEAKPRNNILRKLELDCFEIKDSKDKILMCFTCDPYPLIEEELKITRQAIKILNKYNLNFQILTKNSKRAERDFDLYKSNDTFAVTLVFDNEKDRSYFEPNASPISQRIDSLKKAKGIGIETWVSFEPVLYPDQTLNLVDIVYQYVDLFKVGKINNYIGWDKKINWKEFGLKIIEKFKNYDKNYYIKKDLKAYIF